MYLLVNLIIKLSMFSGACGLAPPWKFIDGPLWGASPRLRTTAMESHSRVDEGVTFGSCGINHRLLFQTIWYF